MRRRSVSDHAVARCSLEREDSIIFLDRATAPDVYLNPAPQQSRLARANQERKILNEEIDGDSRSRIVHHAAHAGRSERYVGARHGTARQQSRSHAKAGEDVGGAAVDAAT